MRNADPDALACDFAEYYHIADMGALPVSVAATLAQGLPEESRSRMGLSGQQVSLKTALLATIADRLGLLIWMGTEDGLAGRNRPVSILGLLTKAAEPEEGYSDADEFSRAWSEITGGEANGD